MIRNCLILASLLSFLETIAQERLPVPAQGTIIRLKDVPSAYVQPRNVDVWLPPGYDTHKKYAVLYMHDGQMLFDSTTTWNRQEWGVDETLSLLSGSQKIRECIVVGIWNNGAYRHSEYFPQKAMYYLDEETRSEVMRLVKDTPRADAYLKFIVHELKPMIDGQFATHTDRKNTFIAGSSMGGLISLYALCEYPRTFYGAACLSTHWPVLFRKGYNPLPDALCSYLDKNLPPPKQHRIYFDYGTATLDSLYPPLQYKVDVVMMKKGFNTSGWITKKFTGEAHEENAWRRRLYIPLSFLLNK